MYSHPRRKLGSHPAISQFFTVKPDSGVVAKSFKEGDKVYINPEKLLPLSRFLGEQSSGGGKGKGKFHQPSYAAILVASNWAAGREPGDSGKDLDHQEVSSTAESRLGPVVECIKSLSNN